MPAPILPVVIGAAQFTQRDVTVETAQNPLDMCTRLARESAATSGGHPRLLESLDTIALSNIIGWKATNAPRLIANALGAQPSEEWVSATGGESALALINAAATRIADGNSQLALIGGCNNFRSLTLAQRAGIRLDWPMGGEGSPKTFGKEASGTSAAESDAGLEMPIYLYPLFENALRFARGQSLEEHRKAMGELFHPFTRVAAANPHAWFPTERSADELTTVTPINRMIGFPYPKYLNAILKTEQAAGAILASEDMARQLGVPEENWVYWRGGAFAAEDPWFATERPSFAEAPAMKTCLQTALANARIGLDEIDLLDLYSCFPVAVAMACEISGLAQDDPRGLTLTGGLPYAGGPGNSYSFHSFASAVERLRSSDGGRAGIDGSRAPKNALVTGNGWYLTKHSATLLSTEPGPAEHPPSAAAPTDATQATWNAPPVTLITQANGSATVETYTIVHGPDGLPERGIIVGRLDETNERFLANTPAETALLEGLEERELIGTRGHVVFQENMNLFIPE